jgi:hypothetical protein
MKPVLTFTPQMFAAAKAGRKDITRRVATTDNQNQLDRLAAAIEKDLARNDGLMTEELAVWNTFPHPYGPPGTILPMATTWAATHTHNDVKPILIEHAQILWFDDGTPKPSWAGKNRPARFLSKSLYHLAPQVQIVSSRAEALHDITEEDAIREGAPPHGQHAQAHRAGFERLWDSINVTRNDGLYAWSKNPVVWRIEFKLLPVS